MIMGQFTSSGSVKALQVVPIMKGVAVAQQICTSSVVSFYFSMVALTLFYMVKSFSAQLPWASCSPEWKDVECVDATTMASGNTSNAISSSELYFT